MHIAIECHSKRSSWISLKSVSYEMSVVVIYYNACGCEIDLFLYGLDFCILTQELCVVRYVEYCIVTMDTIGCWWLEGPESAMLTPCWPVFSPPHTCTCPLPQEALHMLTPHLPYIVVKWAIVFLCRDDASSSLTQSLLWDTFVRSCRRQHSIC